MISESSFSFLLEQPLGFAKSPPVHRDHAVHAEQRQLRIEPPCLRNLRFRLLEAGRIGLHSRLPTGHPGLVRERQR